MKQHPNVELLRQFSRWRNCGLGEMFAPELVDEAINWAIAVCGAADNLINVKGRHHSEAAYTRLAQAVKGGAE